MLLLQKAQKEVRKGPGSLKGCPILSILVYLWKEYLELEEDKPSVHTQGIPFYLRHQGKEDLTTKDTSLGMERRTNLNDSPLQLIAAMLHASVSYLSLTTDA